MDKLIIASQLIGISILTTGIGGLVWALSTAMWSIVPK